MHACANLLYLTFLLYVIQEQDLYQKEGLGLTEVRYTNNQDCIGTYVS